MDKILLLDRLYNDINDIILTRQHPVTGLLPASTAITTHGDYTDAWVRDNVYSIMCVWTLGSAYKKGGEKVRSDELNQATIKLMRGLLQSMMRQAPKVETFKHTLNAMDCLHAKYNTQTGLNVVEDHEWGHLQIDATSVFLLMLAQMTATGLRVINTIDEVDFVQNLIYYIASAYRIPDYGIWERGNKINNGKTEINASSVGMAKAALQALDELNLFGDNDNPRAVVHTIPDAISRARNTLTHLLPRESISKEVDSALLSIIGFPAFAVGDTALANETRNKILSELGGNYGCKRFLWDGHQTSIEDHSRMYYEHSELADFEHIESEWPLFHTYLYIQALFDKDEELAKKYRDQLESVMVEQDGKFLLPELYFVDKPELEGERNNPGSQPRKPNENIPLVWAQSLYFTGLMLDEGLVQADDLDPLQLRNRSTKNTDTQIALVVLAENESVKLQLAEHGVISETYSDISPINVISASELVESFRKVGANKSLALTGRPKRRFQGLATAQTFKINDKPYLSLSNLQYDENNYLKFDAELATADLLRELSYINKSWINNEVAVFTYLVTQDICDSVNAAVLLKAIKELQLRISHTNIGYASASLAIRASKVNNLMVPDLTVKGLFNTEQMSSAHAYSFDLLALPDEIQLQIKSSETDDLSFYQQITTWLSVYTLDSVLTEDISADNDNTINFAQLVSGIYARAQHKHHWLTARLCFSILKLAHKDLADDLSLVCARHIDIVIGEEKHLILTHENSLLKPKELLKLLDDTCHQLLERTLVQEMLVTLGNIVRTKTLVFNGLRSIKINNLLALCAKHDECSESTFVELSLKSPFELNQAVREVLTSQQQEFNENVKFNFCDHTIKHPQSDFTQAVDTDWLEWRSERGLFTRIDDDLLADIWQSLAHTSRIIFADDDNAAEVLDAEITRSSMTPREESFARCIDGLVQHLQPIYYKSAILETLFAFTQHCKNTADFKTEQIILGQVLSDAATLFTETEGTKKTGETCLQSFMTQSPQVLQKYIGTIFQRLSVSELA
ncbi:glycoside hydrolase family 15 protein [Colwellia sp. E2M01]|uniref:glycoside hydrolase family 15 protein n=1 Tax=Colwellia sp. E2M01 TaxID=2841561 RepID=UPI001C07FF50|nr:glycoside hydrolase family 15 protein [Colwellia sp. E2M01]MBU2871162.1 glycoside hydrolase family 15 protein [Colwellia sp. E2M01]